MNTLKRKWHVIGFNLIVLMIFLPLVLPALESGKFLSLLPNSYQPLQSNQIASPTFRAAGTWAIRFLVISLAISPMVYMLGWRKLVPLRKWAGLWAFVFAGLHVLYFFSDYAWRKIWRQDFADMGVVAMLILTVLALTSHRWAMKLLGKNWKRLHRLVYIAGVLVVLHSINGIIKWQKIPNYEHAITELQVYGLVIGVLLLLRIPQVRYAIRWLFKLPKQKREKIKGIA